MNKKTIPSEVRNKRITFRITQQEVITISTKSKDIGISIAEYCREISLKGYIQKPTSQHDLIAIREYKLLLMEFKTNFARISNFIKERNPQLDNEIVELKNSLQAIIEKIKL